MLTSKLQGWDYIKSLMNKCPRCNGQATLGTDALTGKYMVACMNVCCGNTTVFYDENWGKAIVKWNNYTKGDK